MRYEQCTGLTLGDLLSDYFDKRPLDISYEGYMALPVDSNRTAESGGMYRFVGYNSAIPKFGIPMVAKLIGARPHPDGGVVSQFEHMRARFGVPVHCATPVLVRETGRNAYVFVGIVRFNKDAYTVCEFDFTPHKPESK